MKGVSWGQTTSRGGCSLAPYGGFNLASHVGEAFDVTLANWQLLRQGLGYGRKTLATCVQVHGARVLHVRSGGHHASEADAIVSTEADIGVGVFTADCVPVLYAVPGRAVAAAHCGWRGAAAGLAGETLRDLAKAARVSASEVHVWLGASIAQCSYEVGADLRAHFDRRFLRDRPGGKYALDVAGAVVDDLYAAGAVPDSVHRSMIDTYADRRCYSYQRDGAYTGRILSFVRLT